MNICLEIIKNYKQLSSTISKIQALFCHVLSNVLANFPAQWQHAYPQQGYLSGYFRSLLSS